VWDDQIHLLALYTRLLRTLFSGWLHCRNARSTVKFTKMIDLEVSDSNMACGHGLCYRLGARKLLLGDFVAGSLFIHNCNSHPLLELSRGRETWLTRQITSIITIVHAHGTLLTGVARTLQTAVPGNLLSLLSLSCHDLLLTIPRA
jgi:hypothetical protein